jgi:hypothetical protein
MRRTRGRVIKTMSRMHSRVARILQITTDLRETAELGTAVVRLVPGAATTVDWRSPGQPFGDWSNGRKPSGATTVNLVEYGTGHSTAEAT